MGKSMGGSGQGSPQQLSRASSRVPSVTGSEGQEDEWGMGTLRTWGGTGIALDVRANVQAAHNPNPNASPVSPARQLNRGESIRFRRNESINRRELNRAESIKFFRGWGGTSPRAEPSSPSGQMAMDSTFAITETAESMESSYSAQMAWDSRDSSMISPIASTPMPFQPSLLQQATSSISANSSKQARISNPEGFRMPVQLPQQISTPPPSPYGGSEDIMEPMASRSRSEISQVPLPSLDPHAAWQDAPAGRSQSAHPIQRGSHARQASQISIEQVVVASLASPPPSSPPPSYDDALSCRSLGVSPAASPQYTPRDRAIKPSNNHSAASASDTYASNTQDPSSRLVGTQSVPTTSPTRSHQQPVAAVADAATPAAASRPAIVGAPSSVSDDERCSTHSALLPLLKPCNSVTGMDDERHSAAPVIVGQHDAQAADCTGAGTRVVQQERERPDAAAPAAVQQMQTASGAARQLLTSPFDEAAGKSGTHAAHEQSGTLAVAAEGVHHAQAAVQTADACEAGASTGGTEAGSSNSATTACKPAKHHLLGSGDHEGMAREYSLAGPADDVDSVARAAAAAWGQHRAAALPVPDAPAAAAAHQQQCQGREQVQQASTGPSSPGGSSDRSMDDPATGLRPEASRITIGSSSSERSSSGMGGRFRTGSIFRVTGPDAADLGMDVAATEEQAADDASTRGHTMQGASGPADKSRKGSSSDQTVMEMQQAGDAGVAGVVSTAAAGVAGKPSGTRTAAAGGANADDEQAAHTSKTGGADLHDGIAEQSEQPAFATPQDGSAAQQAVQDPEKGCDGGDTQSALPGPEDEDDVKSYVARLLKLEAAGTETASATPDRTSSGSHVEGSSNSRRNDRGGAASAGRSSAGRQERMVDGGQVGDGQKDVKAYVASLLDNMGDVPAVQGSKAPRTSSSNASRGTNSSVTPSTASAVSVAPSAGSNLPRGPTTESASSLSEAAAKSPSSTSEATAATETGSDRGSRGSKGAAQVAALLAELRQEAARAASQQDEDVALTSLGLGEDHAALQAAVAAALSQGGGLAGIMPAAPKVKGGLTDVIKPSQTAEFMPASAASTVGAAGLTNTVAPQQSQAKQRAVQDAELSAAAAAASHLGAGMPASLHKTTAAAEQLDPARAQPPAPASSQQAPFVNQSMAVDSASHQARPAPGTYAISQQQQQQQQQGPHVMQAQAGGVPAAMAARTVSMPVPPALPGTPSDSGSSVASMQVHPGMHGGSMMGRPPGVLGAHMPHPGHPPALRPPPAPPIPRHPGLLYIDGLDRQGRPVVILNAAAIPEKANQDAALKAVLAALQPVVAQPYVLVVVNVVMPSAVASAPGGAPAASATMAGATATGTIDTLAAFWGVSAYKKLARPYRKNVKQIVLVAPSLWCRMMVTMAKPFVSKKSDAKIKQISKLQELPDVTDGEVGLPALGFRFLRDARLLPPPRLAAHPGMHPHMRPPPGAHGPHGPHPMGVPPPPLSIMGAPGVPHQQVGVRPCMPPNSPSGSSFASASGSSFASGGGVPSPAWSAGAQPPGVQYRQPGVVAQQGAPKGVQAGVMALPSAPTGVQVRLPGGGPSSSGVVTNQQPAGMPPAAQQLQQQGASGPVPGMAMGPRSPVGVLPMMGSGQGGLPVYGQQQQQHVAAGMGTQTGLKPGQLQGNYMHSPGGGAAAPQQGAGAKSPTYAGSQHVRPGMQH